MYEMRRSNPPKVNRRFSPCQYDFLFCFPSFVLEHLSSDNQKELYKKLVVKSMIKVNKTIVRKIFIEKSLIVE